MGYHRAGFDVVGVDIKPQPHYPFQFIQGDALVFMERLLMTDTPLGRVHAAGWRLRDFDAIHASPPCQAYSAMSDATGNKDHPRLIQPVRAALALRTAMPWVMENVARSELRATAMLCGTMFGLRVLRHRYFETNISLDLIAPCSHVGTAIGGEYVGHKDGGSTRGRKVPNWTTGEIGAAMGIDWMTRSELRQAIPHRVDRSSTHGRNLHADR